MGGPIPVANAATPAATGPTPGVAPSPAIPTVAGFFSCRKSTYLFLITLSPLSHQPYAIVGRFLLISDRPMQDVIRHTLVLESKK